MMQQLLGLGPLLLVVLLIGSSPAVRAIHWDHAAQLNDDFRLLWNIKGATFTFEMQVRTHGIVGLGFARSSDSKAGADVVVGWVEAGRAYFQDRHTKANSASFEPVVDISQDYALLLGYENSTHTVMRFARRLDTCDDQHDVAISNETMRLLLVYHHGEPSAAEATLPGTGTLADPQMSLRAVVPLQLTARTTRYHRAHSNGDYHLDNVQELELRNDGVTMPMQMGTLEWCRLFELKDYNTKHHMVRFEPAINWESRKYVDAMAVYECQGSASRLAAAAKSTGQTCADFRKTRGVVCEAVVATWSRGSEGYSFPPEAGYPFDSNKERFYLLETHYSHRFSDDIPWDMHAANEAEPHRDSSGMRLWITPTVRQYDAGILSIGMNPDWRHIIPPRQRRVVSEGHCVSDCTRHSFPAEGIFVSAVVMRTHSIGKQVRLRQVRDTEELLPLASDAGIDAEYAEFRDVSPPRQVLPGDSMIVECTYDSYRRDAITVGSQSARGESCQVLAVYYPRQKRMTSCQSAPSLPTVLHSLGIEALADDTLPLLISAPIELAGQTLESRILGYDWAQHFATFERVTRGGSFEAFCMNARHKRLMGTDVRAYHRPRITHSWSVTPEASKRTAASCRVPTVEEVMSGELRRRDGEEYVTTMGNSVDAEVKSMGLSGAGRIGGIGAAVGAWLVALSVAASLVR